jgi:hypothetical protein
VGWIFALLRQARRQQQSIKERWNDPPHAPIARVFFFLCKGVVYISLQLTCKAIEAALLPLMMMILW